MAAASTDEFDAADIIKQYESASTVWHTSLAEGLRTAYGMVNQSTRLAKPLPSQSSNPTRVRLAMSMCHHWHRLASLSWSSPQPKHRHTRLHRIRRDAALWRTTPVTPPQPNSAQHENEHNWEVWALSVIPALNRFMIIAGVTHVNGPFPHIPLVTILD